MELEDRVKALELELKVLKNEIQNTLLDIREQVLALYHPSLTATETTRVDVEPPRAGSVVATQSPAAASEDGSDSEDRDLFDRSVAAEIAPPSQQERTAPRPAPAGDNTVLAKLAEWTSRTMKRIGGEQTGKLIQIYARGGYLTSEITGLLQQLILLSDEEDSTEDVDIKDLLDALLELNQVLGLEDDLAGVLSLASSLQ